MNKINNVRVSKRFLSFLTSLVLMFSSLAALAEENSSDITNETSITEMTDEIKQLTFTDFTNDLDNDLLLKIEPYVKDKYELYSYAYIAYYYENYKYFMDDRQTFLDLGIALPDTEAAFDYITLFPDELAINVTGEINKGMDINELFDISVFIKDPTLRDLAKSARNNYIKAYEKATIDCPEYEEFEKQLKEMEKEDFLLSYMYFACLERILHKHFIDENFTQKEIKEYFIISKDPLYVCNKKYGNYRKLIEAINNKQEQTEFDKYALLYVHSGQKLTGENIDRAVNKINSYINKYQK